MNRDWWTKPNPRLGMIGYGALLAYLIVLNILVGPLLILDVLGTLTFAAFWICAWDVRG